MSDPTKSYRIYCYEQAAEKVTGDMIEAASDADAIATVEAQGLPTMCEIWDGDRLVAQLSGERLQA